VRPPNFAPYIPAASVFYPITSIPENLERLLGKFASMMEVKFGRWHSIYPEKSKTRN
jgi:hypothetical protein